MVGDGREPLRPLEDDSGAPGTPPPEEPPESAAFAGLLFLGGLGSMILGCVYVLFRQIKKKKRSGRTAQREKQGRP